MSPAGRDIDHLYQLPLAEFTSARDELAKRAGANRAAIRALQKPNLVAWAVNQLYWRERGTYEALSAAAKRLRTAQLAALAGRHAEVTRAEAEHAGARRTAAERVRKILQEAGETASAATIHALNDTLEALPAGEAPGRLTRPLRPLGFEALAALMKGGKPARAAEVLSFKKMSATPAPLQARRDAAARKQELKGLSDDLRKARAAERSAAAALARSRGNLAKAKLERETLTERLEIAAARVGQLNGEIRDRENEASKTSAARADLEARLKRHRSS